MTNAKTELIAQLEGTTKIKCASIQYEQCNIVLKIGYSEHDYQKFLELLDFKYNKGFGEQVLYGFVWFEDNTWLERGEYDGSEWWDYKVMPVIPSNCL
jgi:hypothetical protein